MTAGVRCPSVFLIVLMVVFAAWPRPAHGQWAPGDDRAGLEGCTIGVAAGRVTADGRPLLWKTRDAEAGHNEARWCGATPYGYVGVFNADGESPWMAVNVRGFALLNANALDLPGSGNSGNGSFMRRAMAECATVEQFQRLLDGPTPPTGEHRHTSRSIDSTGAAALFETGGSQYWKYDACDPCAPKGISSGRTSPSTAGVRSAFSGTTGGRAIIGALRSRTGLLSPQGIIGTRCAISPTAPGIRSPYLIPPVPIPACPSGISPRRRASAGRHRFPPP